MNGGRDVLLMRMLQSQMTGWLDVIRRGVGAEKVEFSPRDGGKEFAVIVTCKTKAGEKVYESHFSRQRVFGESMRGPQLTWRIQKKACDFARDVMREVAEQRGVKL
jgi:hypothetical protein